MEQKQTEINLDFLGYEVKKIYLDKASNSEDDIKNIGFMFKIIPNKKNGFTKINVIEGVLIEPSSTFNYKLEVIIKGNFKISDGADEDEKYKYILSSASAILFPYLRSIVSLVSSQIEYENVILPVMNFYKIFEEKGLENLLLDANQFEEF